MDENAIRQRIIAGASQLFLRYGFTRTKMGQIAAAAGISRPTLYANFPAKEDVFEAAVLYLNALRHDAIQRELAPLNDLEDQLYTACRLWLVEVYELQQRSPDARDMDDLSFGVVQKVYADLQDLIAGLIAVQAPGAAGSPETLARILVFSVRGLGVASRNVDDFCGLVREQVRLFCRALDRTIPETAIPGKVY